MKKSKFSLSLRPILLSALLLSIPAFYLILPGAEEAWRQAGFMLYGLVAVLFGVELLMKSRTVPPHKLALSPNDWILLAGAVLSAWPTSAAWPPLEWALRLAYAGFIFIRLTLLFGHFVKPNRLLQIGAFGLILLAVSGAGFWLLDPKITNYADGVWLAFTTGATVGYGDLVPSTPASRIFSVFIVLLGYALFSVVTASIAALLVGEDEEQLRKELHADMRFLRHEIAELRAANATVEAIRRDDGHASHQ